jgi:hypothetical protein
MARFKTVNALTAAEKQKRYRERLANRDRDSAAIEIAARDLIVRLKTFEDYSVTLPLPDRRLPIVEYLYALVNEVQALEIDRRRFEAEKREIMSGKRDAQTGELKTTRRKAARTKK